MGAFYLINKESNYTELYPEVFQKMGFSNPIEFQTSKHQIVFYNRILIKENDYYCQGDSAILLDGIVVYKQNDIVSSLKLLLNDYINDGIQKDEILGQFTLVFIHNNQIEVIRDATGVTNVYATRQEVLSSSFLALCETNPKLTINQKALVENMLTGALIGPDTLFKEIQRIEGEIRYNGIIITQLNRPSFSLNRKSNKELIDNQLEELDKYFYGLKPIVEKYGVTIGLTGGFDSRLLMAFAERHFTNIHYFTHWRKTVTKEVEVAKEISTFTNRQLRMHSVIPPLEMTEDQAKNNLTKAFYHCDGQIRTQLYWHEAYNTLDYVKEVYQNAPLGLHGIGGEQYRNYERMIRPYYSFDAWLKHDVLYRYSDQLFMSNKSERSFYNWYSEKVRTLLELGDSKCVKRIHVKRYHNEVYNQSNRAVRLNLENKAVYFTGPFIESRVSTKAYEATNSLGCGLDFQANMIRKINPELAAIESDYGFSFAKGEPINSKLMGVIKEVLPKKQFYLFYHNARKTRKDNFYNSYVNTFPFMQKIDKNLNEILSTLDVDRLKKCKDTGWQLIALGFLVEQFSNKISHIDEH